MRLAMWQAWTDGTHSREAAAVAVGDEGVGVAGEDGEVFFAKRD